jgi:sulfoxide reductase catalytic subunit YedY
MDGGRNTGAGETMLIRRAPSLHTSEITDERLYWSRREFIRAAGAGAVAAALPLDRLPGMAPAASDEDKLTPWEDVTGYNNFYEFGTDKSDPAKYAGSLRTRPWKVEVAGEVAKPAEYDVDDLLRGLAAEERVYRHRCVEGWSMVVPWLGIPLVKLIDRLQPTGKAKYVEVTTLLDSRQMPGQRQRILDWPYVEGLRMDEARHPLTLLVTGVYGKPLPNQNGAPMRLVIPWKYGFKGGKSIVKIRFTERQPRTTWNLSAPDEYGFYANVNPEVDHPRWSQARERRVGEFFKRKTLMFNGYADEVGSLYTGMDLRKYY